MSYALGVTTALSPEAGRTVAEALRPLAKYVHMR